MRAPGTRSTSFVALAAAVLAAAALAGCPGRGSPGVAEPPSGEAPARAEAPSEEPGRAAVLFDVSGGSRLVPVACAGPDGSPVEGGGQRCLDLVPEGAEVGLEGGGRVAIGRAVPVFCAGEEEAEADRAFELAAALPSGQPPGAAPRWAIWPAGRARDVRAPEGAGASAGAPDLEAVTRAAREAARSSGGDGGATFRLTQVSTADLDGDGADETLFAGTFRAEGEEPSADRWSGLLARSGAAPATVVVLAGDPLEDHEVLAVLDLEGDGRDEVFVLSSYYEGMGVALLGLSASGPRSLGGWFCGL